MILKLWRRFMGAWHFATIVNRWQDRGHPAPFLAASNEVFYRAEFLEDFRDFASTEYLTRGVDLEQSKTAFLRAHVDANTTMLDRSATALLRSVILSMGADEALHPNAWERYEAETDRMIEELMADANAMYGGKTSPLIQRVLR